MIVAMQAGATEEQIDAVISAMEEAGVDVHRTTGEFQTILAGVGPTATLDLTKFEMLPGVLHVHRISAPYKLAGRAWRPEGTVVEFRNGATIGGQQVAVIAGPCAVENREQIFAIAACVKGAGGGFLRGGAYKPRSSPYSFQGLGIPGLELMREAADANGLSVVSEVMEIAQIEPMLSSEYILSGGNYDVILCERGIRTYETATRNTMDISAIPVLKKLSHLPVVGDPSHGTGRRDMVPAMAKAAVAAGADALLLEIHPNADKAVSDAAQTLFLDQFEKLVAELRVLAEAVGRTL